MIITNGLKKGTTGKKTDKKSQGSVYTKLYQIHPVLVTIYGLSEGTYSGLIQAVVTNRDIARKEKP